MLATIAATPTERVCDVSSSLQRSVQRRTSFLIRDILGKNNEDAFDSDETEKDCSRSHLSDEQQLRSSDSAFKMDALIEKGSCRSSPQEWMETQPNFQKDFSSENQASPKRLPSPVATSCCRECNINNSQRIASLSYSTLKNSLSPSQECVSDEEKDRTTLFLNKKTSSNSFPQDGLQQLRKKSNDFNQTRNLYTDDFLDKSYLQREKTSYQQMLEKQHGLVPKKKLIDKHLIEFSRSISNNCEVKAHSIDSSSNHSNPFSDTSVDQVSADGLNTFKDANIFRIKNRVHPPASDVANRYYCKQEDHQHNVASKIQESVAFSHPLYNDLIINPNTQSLVDLNYAYNVRAAAGLPFSHIPIQFSPYTYNNVANVVTAASELLKARRLNHSCSAQLHESYQRCKLLEHCYNDNVNHRLLLHPALRPVPVTTSENEDLNNSPSDLLGREEHHSSLSLPLSPFSEPSAVSPPTDERPIQLPAYLRSRLGGSSSSDSATGENGKMKKCRRSRTVFTELQMLGLEKRFEKQQYLSTPDRVELAELLGLSQLQVKTWYQNRRMKWKKQVMQAGGTEPPTKQKGRPRKIRPGEENSSSKSTSETIPLIDIEKATDFCSAND